MFLLNPMRLNQIRYHLDRVVEIGHTHSQNVGGIDVKVSDCPGLITKDIKNQGLNHYEIIGLREQDSYSLTYNHQGKEVMVNIPLGRKESYKA